MAKTKQKQKYFNNSRTTVPRQPKRSFDTNVNESLKFLTP